MASGYPYHPLNSDNKEIRVLLFRPQDTFGSKPLRARIAHMSLLSEDDDLPVYFALSYTWGPAGLQKRIIIDDITVWIPWNAEIALRHLHFDSYLPQSQRAGNESEHAVWIDSVCINQDDIDERNMQVALMGQVYSRAHVVLIWLDSDFDGLAKAAIESIRAIYKQAGETTQNFKDVGKVLYRDFTDTDGAESSKLEVMPTLDTHKLAPVDVPALESFFSAEWFSRVWVLQESMLAGKAYCFRGLEYCRWIEVVAAARWMFHFMTKESDRIRSNKNIIRARKMFDHKVRFGKVWKKPEPDPVYNLGYLEPLLVLASGFDASDSRDKVFAILSLLGHYPDSLAPDYRMPVTEVFTRTCRAAIVGGRSLSLPVVAQQMENRQTESELILPSWVMRFRDPLDPNTLIPLIDNGAACAPGCAELFDVDDAASGNILQVKGLIVDEVGWDPYPRELFKEWNISSSSEGFDVTPLTDLARAWFIAEQHLESYDEEVLLEQFYKTFSAEDPLISNEGLLEHRVELGFRACMHCMLDLSAVEDPEEAKERGRKEMMAAIQTVMKRTMNRSFFVTKGNRIGTGFPQIRCGDQICILFGADAPVVLRPDGDHWTLVGDAYLAGVMNGESVNQLRAEGRFEDETRTFSIW